jgi:hypothetical protein
MAAAQVGLELVNVPGLTLAAISFSNSCGDFLAEVIVGERGGFALLDEKINAMGSWVFDVCEAVACRDGG